MLSSTILRQSSLRPRPNAQDALLSTRAVPLAAARLQHQARGFRFGIWTAHVNPALRRELRRQEKLMRQKYTDAMARHMSFDQTRYHLDTRSAFKRIINGCFGPNKARWSWHFASQDEPTARRAYASAQSWHGNQYSASQSRRNVEREANKATGSAQTRTYTDTTRTEPSNIEQDYIIDPITNRRVPKSSYGTFETPIQPTVSSAATNFGTEPSLFPTSDEAKPHHSNGPPPTEELNKYNNVTIDSAEPADFADSGPTLFTFDSTENRYSFTPSASEEYSLNHLSAEEEDFPLQEGELDKYKAVVDEIHDGEESQQPYDDLKKYKPVFSNESTETKEVPAYEDLGDYKPFLHDEGREVKTTQAYEDLGQYQPYLHNEGAQSKDSPSYGDLDGYKPYLHNEALSAEPTQPAYEDLGDYGPYQHNEGVVDSSETAQHDDLDQYQPYMYKETEREAEAMEDPPADDLAQYQPKVFDDFPDMSVSLDEPFQQYGDLDKYKAFRDQALEGEPAIEKDVVADCLDEYDSKQEDQVVAAGDGIDLVHKMGDLNVGQTEPVCVFDSTIHGVSAESPKRVPDHTSTSQEDDVFNSPYHMSSMTGNYVRDFPEQFAQSWTAPMAPEIDSAAAQAEERAFAERLNAASTMPIYASGREMPPSKPRLESALNRRSTRRTNKVQPRRRPRLGADLDSYSAEPQGLETSYAEECRDQPKGPSFVRTYGTQRHQDDQAPAQVAEPPVHRAPDDGKPYHRDPEVDGQGYVDPGTTSAAPKPVEPTIYKVLAYDAGTQNISIAETTSDVPDQSSSSAPADILLRLTNPSRFFPYFAPLQAEGFEIVSGDGDVLVFRKVRATMRRVNPIDLMGTPMALPNAAAFASPTGFVNYDIPRADEAETAEQDDASGAGLAGSTAAGKQSPPAPRKKMGFGKKVLFAGTSALGLTYATGVVAEYFARPNPRSGRF
ncbi:uncharacterized protein B0I36DRAFT_323820 [Microdochium trichocladiopsis]|uniref:Uncharacterized protein n=1 Tax=Microdochium trichocladiopsis TaxID=1682393 RepID=A0A9P8Y9F8_9PEZI|nr:uncharacterized protein B0I36DRAFT_323820 [Microdochium trichocladiopsis]KAH7031386.1 hypothetical protein B0I36DRAFT_323820 [Microdochium trichocladiopsis]